MLFHKVWLVILSIYGTCCPFTACQHTSHVQNATSSQPGPYQQDLRDMTLDNNASFLEEAEKEQGYYLHQLFHLYGENNTLSYQGLTMLLKNLGLGKVQVVQIQHAELGHDHVSHLDILDVQENKHKHIHSNREHLSSPTPSPLDRTKDGNKRVNIASDVTHDTPHTTNQKTHHGEPALPDEKIDPLHPQQPWPHRDILQQFLQHHHLENAHQHEDCLNVTQLLLNFGLSWASEITPKQFTLLCPALLYQIDSRVCIKHNDQVTHDVRKSQPSLLKVLGWGALAVTVISVPSLLAVAFVPLLRRPLFRYLLRFLVALAVGTLCGDALLHLLPHSQEDHTKSDHRDGSHPVEPVLKGLAVLGGIFVLFLVENLIGLLRQRRRQKKHPQRKKPAEDEACTTVLWELGHPVNAEFCDASGVETDCQHSRERQVEEPESHMSHHGHSHSAASGGIAEFVWMVLLGDGVHNFTDGLAIGAAFSAGFSGGLSTTVAVFCHELPHELGDFAVLLQTGVPVRRVLCFTLISAFLSYLGMLVGVLASQSSAHLTPWIFAVTAGIFLYVALVDMLPQMLHGKSSDICQGTDCVLHGAGFLIGGGIMLCIALFQDHMVIFDV
ncbi:zinc transporter ZIP5 [Hyperolius riggenbachi]|uniref:zinc transporter ZIP5 n=1 Tax=Hyperolius riggenbachi TaxID=752182 RepID=UPI0035A334BC